MTTLRLIFKVGLVARYTTELLLARVESISVTQGLLGRMLNYGDLIHDPVAFRNEVQRASPRPAPAREADARRIMKDVMRRLLVGATVALLLGGCASYAWQKPDATAEARTRDDTACRAEARELAYAFTHGSFGTPWHGSPGHRPWTGFYADPSWQLAAEERAFERCMRGRGYDLVRTDKPR